MTDRPELTKPNSPGKDGHAYGHAVFEPLLNIHLGSNTCTPMPPVTVASVDAKNHNNVTVTMMNTLRFIYCSVPKSLTRYKLMTLSVGI